MSDTEMEQDEEEQELELDFLGEVTSKGLDKASDLVCDFLGKKVKMGPPKVLLLSNQELGESFRIGDFDRRGVSLNYTGTYNGTAYLLFKKDHIEPMIQELTGDSPSEKGWDHLVNDMVREMGNIVLNGVVGTMSNMVQGNLKFQVPVLFEGCLENEIEKQFGEKTEVCFMGIGLFHVAELEIDGVISFSFYFDDIQDLLSSIKTMKKS